MCGSHSTSYLYNGVAMEVDPFHIEAHSPVSPTSPLAVGVHPVVVLRGRCRHSFLSLALLLLLELGKEEAVVHQVAHQVAEPAGGFLRQ